MTGETARRIAAAMLAAVLLAGCAGTRGPGADAVETAPIGYVMEGDETVFRFAASEYVNVTRNDNGEWIPIVDIDIESVSVAGDFNGWSVDAWRMSKVRDGFFELRKNVDLFAGRDKWPFKFVLNGFYWVEPPPRAPNRIASGVWRENRSWNLVLRVR